MATRLELKQQLRAMLGLASDDPLASDAVLNPLINQAYQGLVAELAELAPDRLSATASLTLTAGVFPTPATVYQIRALRETDAEGTDLNSCPWAELPSNTSSYAVVGVEAPFDIYVSDDVTVTTLWLLYTVGAGANELVADTTVPSLLPVQFHDVIALEATFAAALGDEQRVPADIARRREDRKGRLFAHMVRLAGPGPASRTRMAVGQGQFP